MTRLRVFVTRAVVSSAVSSLFGQDGFSSLPAADALFREKVSRLGGLELSDGQIAQIKELAAKFGPEIEQADRQARRSEAQQNAQSQALARAVQHGVRGARARALLAGDTVPTDEQRSALQLAMRLRREFDQAVAGLLTKAQLSRSPPQAPPVEAPNGFLIVQLSHKLRDVPRTAKRWMT